MTVRQTNFRYYFKKNSLIFTNFFFGEECRVKGGG